METPDNGKPRPPRFARTRRILVLLAVTYLCVIGMLVVMENWLIFRPTRAAETWFDPRAIQLQARDVELLSADGNRLHAWWCPSAEPAATAYDTLLYLHGNGGNLSYWGKAVTSWRKQLGTSILIVDYPGYGHSQGRPSETGCYAAADAAYDWLMQKEGIKPERLLIVGESLGGGVATDLAHRRPYGALVLLCSFTSVPDMAQALYPWVPGRWLVRTQFDNLAKIGQCRRPLFIAHGMADNLIPFSQGERLFAAAAEPKCFLPLRGQGHMLQLDADFFGTLRRFLAGADVPE